MRYVISLTVLCLALSGLTLGYTLSTDPFGIFHNDSETELSRINQFWYMRTSKPLRLLRRQPDMVIVGTSRTARLSPDRVGIEDGFNAALPGATAHEQRITLAYAIDASAPARAVIGLDFDAFRAGRETSRLGFNPALMRAEGAPSHWLNVALTLKRLFFSTLAVQKSYEATHLAGQRRDDARYQADGSWWRPIPQASADDFEGVGRQRLSAFRQSADAGLDMTEYRRLLQLCQASALDCQLLVTPVHVFDINLLSTSGLLPLWQQWHEQLVRINDEVAAEYGQRPIPLWGFNTFAPAVAEALSTREDNSNPWFKDSIHFTPRFADLMLGTITGQAGAGNGDTGIRLDQASLPLYLDTITDLRQAFNVREKASVDQLHTKLGLAPTSP